MPSEAQWVPLVAERRTVDVVCESETDSGCTSYTVPATLYDYAVVFSTATPGSTGLLEQTLDESSIVFDNGAARVYRLAGADAVES
jgi:hypothetical protein